MAKNRKTKINQGERYVKERIVWVVCREIGHQISRLLRKLILMKK